MLLVFVCILSMLICKLLVILFVRWVLKVMGMVWLFLFRLICWLKKGWVGGMLKLENRLLFLRKKFCCFGKNKLNCVRLVCCIFIFIWLKLGLIVRFKLREGERVILVFIFVWVNYCFFLLGNLVLWFFWKEFEM